MASGIRNLPAPEVEPVFHALAGGFLSTILLGSPVFSFDGNYFVQR